MAALLVMLAVMTVLMSVAMPVWRHQARREKEEELVFHGYRSVRAIRHCTSRRDASRRPSIRSSAGSFLRKKYKDPVTNATLCRLARPVVLPGRRVREPAGPARSRGRGRWGPPGQPRPPESADQHGPHSPVAHRAASSASSARAPPNRFASISDAPTTTSGCSCTWPAQPGGPGGIPDGRGGPGGPGGRGRPVGPGGGGGMAGAGGTATDSRPRVARRFPTARRSWPRVLAVSTLWAGRSPDFARGSTTWLGAGPWGFFTQSFHDRVVHVASHAARRCCRAPDARDS